MQRLILHMFNPVIYTFTVMLTTACYMAYGIGAEEESDRPQSYIQFDNTSQRYTAFVDNQPFDWVIHQLEELAGIEFTVYKDDYTAVSAQFENLPLDKAISQLLYGASYMISSGDTVRIFVLSREDESHSDAGTAEDDTAPAPIESTVLQSTTTDDSNATVQSSSSDFKHHLIESLGNSPELDELRSQLEQMPDMDLSEEEIRLLQNSSEGQITDILLNKLLQVDVSRPDNESVSTDQPQATGE